MASLIVSLAGGAELRYRIPIGRITIGRGTACDVMVPGKGVSRRHCVIERTGDAVRVIDRSRNGTRVDGRDIETEDLSEGALLEIGDAMLRFVRAEEPATSTTGVVRPRTHEELVGVEEGGIAAARARLLLTRGPQVGARIVLDRPVATVGGGDDDVRLDGLPPRALSLRVVRGRVTIESTPGVRATLAGAPIAGATPVWLGEQVAIGDHAFTVEQEVRPEVESADHFGDLVGTSPVMRRLFGLLRRIAAHDHAALITGESGTGKELAARAIHDHGLRGSAPFVAINCAALPDTLVESVLFGHEKGAFTGATSRQDGAFHAAHRGTLFLDEVGELRLDTQAKLLRALESGAVQRVGSMVTEVPDVRILAATNRDLAAMVREGTFRGDLYFRLSVLKIHLPPLRDRIEDVPLLARTLTQRLLPDASLDAAALAALRGHRWPGNVRELKNVLIRARVLYGAHISSRGIHFDEDHGNSQIIAEDGADDGREAILEALARVDGNRSRAAAMLGIPRSSLLYRMKRYGIS
jgi:DNA-binding NtrC family response regulator